MQERIQEAYFQTSKVLNVLYKKRKRTLLFQKVMWGIMGLYLVFMLVLLGLQFIPYSQSRTWNFLEPFKATPNNPYATLYPIIGLIILLYPTTIAFAKAFQKFKTIEKETMAKMVKMLFPQVEFTQGAMAPAKEAVKSKLFAWIKKGSPIYNYGQIRCRITDTEINIADLGIVESNMTNQFLGVIMTIPILNMLGILYQNVFKNLATNKLGDNTNYSFRGMFCWMHFKKKLNGHTVMLPKNKLTQLDQWASLNFKEEQEIHLEDPRFTRNFTVYSTDQVEARYVLSSSIMEKIVALKEKFDRPICMSFQDKQLYFAVKNNNGLFSISSGNLNDIKVVEELAYEIETALGMPKELFGTKS
ncbi:DUF3137 domain-containing protein [Maribacter sp. CXY002]|uniref:DUF3137 domain-containing protein n=1 Tax=Maribacter luteocoastalis TaxID=3407671 RepID=UPI003B67AB7A